MQIVIDITDKPGRFAIHRRCTPGIDDTPKVTKMGLDLFRIIMKAIPALKDEQGVSANMRVARFCRSIKDPEERARHLKAWQDSH